MIRLVIVSVDFGLLEINIEFYKNKVKYRKKIKNKEKEQYLILKLLRYIIDQFIKTKIKIELKLNQYKINNRTDQKRIVEYQQE